MSGFVVDLSSAWPSCTGKALKGIGATGVIGYAGCSNPAKNVSKARFEDWLDSGLMVGLVIENGAQDLNGGASVGAAQGKELAKAAIALGYDVANCALYTAADWNSRGTELDHIDAAMKSFGDYVGQPGLYGNSYALDRCTQSGHATYRWQSNSTSYSDGPSAHAHLLQRYNDARAKGLTVDVNDIQNTPLGLMGEDMLTEDQVRAVVHDEIGKALARIVEGPDGKLHQINTLVWDNVQPLAVQIDALAKAMAAKTVDVDKATLTAAIVGALAELAKGE